MSNKRAAVVSLASSGIWERFVIGSLSKEERKRRGRPATEKHSAPAALSGQRPRISAGRNSVTRQTVQACDTSLRFR